MTTTYYADIAIPGQDERLIIGPIESVPEIVRAFMLACERLSLDKPEHADEPPEWHPFAEEEDGERRDLTDTEEAALLAAFEQVFGGLQARLHPVDSE